MTVDFDVSHPWHGRTGDERKMIAWIEDEAFGLSLSSWPREDPVLVVVKYGLSNGSLLVRWCSEYRSAGGHFADLLERDRGAGVPFQQVGYGFSRISPKGGIVPPLIRPSDWHFRPNLRTILSTVLAATLWPNSPNRHMCICRCQHPFGLLKKILAINGSCRVSPRAQDTKDSNSKRNVPGWTGLRTATIVFAVSVDI